MKQLKAHWDVGGVAENGLQEDPSLLDRVIMVHETWAYHYNICSKKEASHRKHFDAPPQKKNRQVKSFGKVMIITFLGRQGMVYQHTVPHSQMVPIAYYSEQDFMRVRILRENYLP